MKKPKRFRPKIFTPKKLRTTIAILIRNMPARPEKRSSWPALIRLGSPEPVVIWRAAKSTIKSAIPDPIAIAQFESTTTVSLAGPLAPVKGRQPKGVWTPVSTAPFGGLQSDLGENGAPVVPGGPTVELL